MAEKQQAEELMEEVDVGDELLSWESWEFPPQDRSKTWYIAAGIISVGLIIYAVYAQIYLFAIIILMMGVITLVNGMRKPNRVMIILTSLGVVIGHDFYPYDEIKDFSVVYKPPVKILYIDFKSLMRPLISAPLEDINPNDVRNILLTYCFENLEREEENLTDMLRRLYKL